MIDRVISGVCYSSNVLCPTVQSAKLIYTGPD